jgi:hypothetical protein
MMTAPQLLFVAGIPGTGKSHFGQWLAHNRGYIHVDAEIPGDLERAGLRSLWDEAYRTAECIRLAEHIRRLGRPLIFNWGFPLHSLPIAVALKTAGFDSWWFDADLIAARQAFSEHGLNGNSFDLQVASIQSSTQSINALFEPKKILVLDKLGARLPPEEIFSRICHSV